LLLPIGMQVPELRFSSNGSQQFSIKRTQALAPELSEVDTRPFPSAIAGFSKYNRLAGK
jgi:hypothetical protein